MAVVRAWHDALNRGEIDFLASLLHDDVEFGGPRGSGHGAEKVRDWARRAGITLEPLRWFQRDEDVVVAQQARWRDPETGVLGSPIDAASTFRIRDGLVQRVVRYETLQDALTVVDMDASSEVPPTSVTRANIETQNSTHAPAFAIADLPYVGTAHELEGYLHGDAHASVILFNGPPGSGPRLHRHPYAEILLVQEGEATFTVGEAAFEMTAGQIAVAPANVPHKFINSGDGPLRQIDIHANDRFVTEWLEE